MKSKNLILLILALFVGMNASYANNAKVKKIKYAKNVFYIGEAVKTDDGWKPKGKGVLYILSKNLPPIHDLESRIHYEGFYKCTIEGTFENNVVTDASLKPTGYVYPFERIAGDVVFAGNLSYVVSNPSKKLDCDTHISFISGEFKARSGYIVPISSPIEYTIGEFKRFTCEVTRNEYVDEKFGPESLDPLGLRFSDLNYKAKVWGELQIDNRIKRLEIMAFEGHLMWADGSSAKYEDQLKSPWGEVMNGEDDGYMAHYPQYNTTISAYGYGYEAYQCVLKDGTVVMGTRLDEAVMVDLGDTYFRGKVEIPGVERFKSLAFNSNNLTKDDVTFKYGILVKGEKPYDANKGMVPYEFKLGGTWKSFEYVRGDEVLNLYIEGKTYAQWEAEEQARKLAEEKAKEEKWRQEEAKEKAKKEERKQFLINKYGTHYANAILKNEILEGMTYDMVGEIVYQQGWEWKNRIKSNGSIIEQYESIFGTDNISITFRNGKVVDFVVIEGRLF